MQPNWIDVSSFSFNVLLLLERIQLSWFPGWVPETELALALKGNPVVEWYIRHKCPELNDWLDKVLSASGTSSGAMLDEIRRAEIAVMQSLNDLIVYAVDPAAYDAQPFLKWDSEELLSLTDFSEKTVIDVGAGTGRLALAVASIASNVFAVEPVANLRTYLREQAREKGLNNVYPVDGLVTQIPFPDHFADITIGGHVFGDQPEEEYRELSRVTKQGGRIILCPGNNDEDNSVHEFLSSKGFRWSRFEEPGDGMKRKYWITVE
jgi:SAM-dependent methyltransferase